MDHPGVRITGTEEFTVTAVRLYERISDAGFLLSCVPGALCRVIESSNDRAAWEMTPPVPLMPGTLELELTFLRRVGGALTHVRVEGKGLGGGGIVETVNEIEATEDGCRVTWTATVVAATGTLRMIPRMVLEPGLRQAISRSWEAIGEKLRPADGPRVR